MIYLLIVLLTIMLMINFNINGKCFGAPGVIFNLSFLFSAIWAGAYAEKWALHLHTNTFGVIVGAVLIFSLCTYLRKLFPFYIYEKEQDTESDNSINQPYKIWFIIFIQLLILYLYIKKIMSDTEASSLRKAVAALYNNTKEVSLPFYLRVMIAFLKAWGFWFSYQFMKLFVIYKKVKIEFLVIIGISIMSTFLTGSRGDGILIITSGVVFGLIFEFRENPIRRKIGMKKILLACIVVAVGIRVFPLVGKAIGRTTRLDPMEYVGAYVGAEIKNLDTYLNTFSVPTNTGTWGSSTFYSIESTLSRYMDLHVSKNRRLHLFQRVNGIYLGNVYTMLYEPLFDFGYKGCFLIVAILAFIMQGLYERAISVDLSKTSLSSLIYGYCAAILVFSFFSFWYGYQVLCTGFIYVLVGWWFVDKFFYGFSHSLAIRRTIMLDNRLS